MTLHDALISELDEFRIQLRLHLLATLEDRAPLAVSSLEQQRGSKFGSVEAWRIGYEMGVMELLQALDEGGELLVEIALRRFYDAQN
jgi:hypothetical protein